MYHLYILSYKRNRDGNYGGAPRAAVVVKASGYADVALALAFVKRHRLRMTVYSTGHDFKMRSVLENGLVLDFSNMLSIEVNEDREIATVGTGARFGDILQEVNSKTEGRYTVASGYVRDVGPYGFSTAGGISVFSTTYGMGADMIHGFECVTANGQWLRVEEGDGSEHQELLRAVRGSGGTTFCIVLRLILKILPEFSNVETYVSNTNGYLIGLPQIRSFSANMPDNVVFWYQLVRVKTFVRTQIIAGCYGERDICRAKLAPLMAIGRGKVRSYSSHYSFMNNVMAGAIDNGTPHTAVYQASIAVPGSTLRNNPAALSQFDDFVWNAPAGTVGSVNMRPLGGVSARNDIDGELTSVSTQFRKANLFINCLITWEQKGPQAPQGIVEYVDEFYKRVMRDLGTDDRWQYTNEGQHYMPNWYKKYWNGAAGYQRLMAVKDAYDPHHLFSAYHFAGADESVVSLDIAHCPSECRAANRGCTNIPPSMTCAPFPSYRSVLNSDKPGPHSCEECSHTITVTLQNDGRGEDIGFWILMTNDGECGPVSRQPEMIHSKKIAAPNVKEVMEYTISDICSGAEYQIGIFFAGDDLEGSTCCTSGGSKIFIDGVLVYASIDYQTVYTITVPRDMEACSPVNDSPCESTCPLAAPVLVAQRSKKMKTSRDNIGTEIDAQNSAVSRKDAALVSTMEDLFDDTPSQILNDFLVTTNRMIATIRDRSFGNGFKVCEMIDALNDVSEAVRGTAIIQVSALPDGCLSDGSNDASDMTMLHRSYEMRTQYAAHRDDTNATEFSTSSLRSKRNLLMIKRSNYQSFNENFAVELFNLLDIDADDNISMNEIHRGTDILTQVISQKIEFDRQFNGVNRQFDRYGDKEEVSPCSLESSLPGSLYITSTGTISRTPNRQFDGLGTITHTRSTSFSAGCLLAADTFTSRCVTPCDGDEDGGDVNNEDEDDNVDSLPFSPFC